MMRQPFDTILRAIKRVPTVLHDRLFELACRVLLPISTMCKVCNILRGMAFGFVLGVLTFGAFVLLYLLRAA
ncbi:MAG: hypothetical protein Q8Q81_00620 [Oxalobacteraceae bacterium]|nr:hypothetical protein [Oxalobacteraceae bacterium]